MPTNFVPSLPRARHAARAAALLVLAAAVWSPAGERGLARGSVPSGPPTFSAPTVFTNRWFPFTPGAVKVFRGREDGERSGGVDLYGAETRTFSVGSAAVTTRVLREYSFAKGELKEISTNYFAQADDGTVYYFGEVVDVYEGGVVVDHGGSWLVGGPGPGDPGATLTVAVPAVFMPADPAVGDEFRPEDVPSGPKELDTIRRIGVRVKTPAGRFEDCIEVRELNPDDGSTETKWYAPGVGVVRSKGDGEILALDGSTLRSN